jgi:hypothetical protein
MDPETHNRYFRDIDFNRNREVSWERFTAQDVQWNKALTQVFSDVYEARVLQLISSCQHVGSVEDLLQSTIGELCTPAVYLGY